MSTLTSKDMKSPRSSLPAYRKPRAARYLPHRSLSARRARGARRGLALVEAGGRSRTRRRRRSTASPMSSRSASTSRSRLTGGGGALTRPTLRTSWRVGREAGHRIGQGLLPTRRHQRSKRETAETNAKQDEAWPSERARHRDSLEEALGEGLRTCAGKWQRHCSDRGNADAYDQQDLSRACHRNEHTGCIEPAGILVETCQEDR